MIDKFVTGSDLAKVLSISHQRVSQLVKENVIKKEADGKFDLSETVEAYYAFKFKTNEELNFQREHTLLEKTKRETAQLELAKMKGELHEAKDVEFCLTNMILTFRNRMLSIPSKLAPILLGQKSIAKLVEVLDQEIRQALTELSKYDPAMFGGDDTIDDEEI